MGDADDPTSKNDDPASKEDQHYNGALQTHLQILLPFTKKVINNSERLNILPTHVSKLRSVYDLVDGIRLQPDQLKMCKNILYDLHDSYSIPLNYYLPPDFKTSWMQETKLNNKENNLSSNVRCISNKSNQNQNSESTLSNKIPVPGTSYENIVNNQMGCLEVLTSNNENNIDNNFANIKIGESSCSKTAVNDSMLAKNNLPEFLDSRLRLNKIIGMAANDAVAKIKKFDASILHNELIIQIFDEIVKQKTDPVVHDNILKGINLDNIDINFVKELTDGIKRASCEEPIQPMPLPPLDLMKLGASKIHLISTTEPNSIKVTQDNVLSKSSTIICTQLNSETNKLHKTGSSNETKEKLITALKPGKLIELENSKVICASLHIDSLQSVIKANEKNTDIKTSVAGISVPRSPRIRHKSLLSSEIDGSAFNTPATLIPKKDNSNAKLFKTTAQEMSVYYGQSSTSHTNIQPIKPQFSTKYNGNSIQFKNRPLSQNPKKYNYNNDQKKNYSQFNNFTQTHVNPSYTEPFKRYWDPEPDKSHNNDPSKRDPRKFKSVKTTKYSNSKEFIKSKYLEQNKGYAKNKNKMNQDQDQYRKLSNEETEKTNIISSSYDSFGSLNETVCIKNSKIPKIKHNKALNDNSTVIDSKLETFGNDKNNTDVLKTEKNFKIPLKADTIREQHLVDGQKTEFKKSNKYINDPKITDKINDSHTNKDLEIEKTKNSNTYRDLKIKRSMMNNKSKKDDGCSEINLEEIAVNIPSNVNKDELDSESEQNSILMDHTNQYKPKKQKKYSKDKKFEKIVKDATDNLNDEVWGPKRKASSILMNKAKILKTLKLNNSNPTFEKDITAKKCEILEFSECSKNLNNVSIQNLEDVSGQIEIRHNMISSPSKEQSGVVHFTTTNILCKSQEENIVSSDEVNSTPNKNPNIEKNLIEIFKNPELMNCISMLLQDQNKIEKLYKLINISDDNSNGNNLKKKDILFKEQPEIGEEKNIKKNRRKKKENLSEKSSNKESNEMSNVISDDNNFNQAETIGKTKKKNSHLNKLNKGNNNYGNIYGHSSTDQHKLESKEHYGHFKILKHRSNPESNELKIVIGKIDKHTKRKENCSSDISCNDKPMNVEKALEVKSKRPFLGPLSVKLARQKMKMERKNLQNERDIKNQLEFEPKIVRKESKSFDGFDKKGKLNSETLTKSMKDEPNVLICPFQNSKPFYDETNCNKPVQQNSNTSALIVNKPKFELIKNKISAEITSKTVTENKFMDKFYFQTSDNCLECKFCNYKDDGLNIVRHYKDQHSGAEVLPSRLPMNRTKSLIHQSLKEHFGYLNSQDSKPFCLRFRNVVYTCVFCQDIFHDYFKFYDHITGHTGEYRYKCKMCEQIYSNADDLDKHILEHTDYDKTDGISNLIFPNPILAKHMASQHLHEDKKLNGHWTVIRISMSVAEKIYTDSSIDFDNLVGCLPPIQSNQVISKNKDYEDQAQQLTVIDLNVLSNEQKQPDSFFSIKNKCIEQNIDEIVQASIIDKSPQELSTYENLLDLTIDINSPELTINENPPESNIDENLPESVICVNLPVRAYDKTLPESNMINFLPEQVNQSPTKETKISTEQHEIEYSEYTLKEKSKKCVLAGLSCELINSMLLFKCSVSNCLENQFSTVVLIDFSKHINENHQFVIWDGNCEACHHKLQIVSGQYVRNALEHLISHHLVLKNNEQHPNTIGSKTEGLSSLCQEKKFQRKEYSLRVCHLPGDRLSIHTPTSLGISNIYDMAAQKSLSDNTNSINNRDFIENNIFENSEQSSNNILLVNQCPTSVNLNINHGSDDKRFPLLSSQISDVKSLKKIKVNTSKTNSSASNNNDLNMWMKAKINCENVLPNPKIFLEAGQQIVNNGVPLDGTIFCLIDTAYKKDYIRKVRYFPMHVMKTELAFAKMSALPNLLNLYKCMKRTCSQMYSYKESFKLHLKSHCSDYARRKKKNQIYNVQQYKMCAYCFKAFDDEESLANHIAEKYTFCKYFCPYCFYCAYTESHVLVHQSVVHTNIKNHLIIKLDDSTCENTNEMLLVVDFKKFLLPYKCNVGCCGFSCYLLNEFVEHLNQEHQQCDKLFCYICANKDEGEGFFALHPTLMITHFKLHHINKYQCIFCLFGSETIDLMIKHLALEHFEYEPLCLERSTVSDNCDSKNIRNLKILKLKKVIDNGMVEVKNVPVETIPIPEFFPRRSTKRSIESPDNLSLVMKSARIDEGSQPSDTVVQTYTYSAQMAESSTSMSLTIDNELNMIDDVNQNDTKESLKTTRIRSESNNIKKKSNVSSNDDVVLSEKKELNNYPKKRKCLEIKDSIIQLDKLFVCKECDEVFSNGDMYLAHLKVCPFWNNVAGRKCMYCVKVFKNKSKMKDHVKLHGPDRFKCIVCNLKVPSQQAVRLHMKRCHTIINVDFVSEHPNLTDLDKDNFIALEDMTVMQRTTQEQPNYTNNSVKSLTTQQNTSLKRKHCSTVTDNKDLYKQSKHLRGIENLLKQLEQQALESTEPTLVPNCQKIESTPLRMYRNSRMSKSPKMAINVPHNMLPTKLNNNSRAIHVKSFESSKTIIVNDKRTSSPTKEKNTEREK